MKILMVCTGNICRSPTAEGVLRHLLKQYGITDVTVDSAGTHNYHIGEAPDPRSIAPARKRGIEIDMLRARRVCKEDFYAFDLILAMDDGHLNILQQLKPKDATAEVALFLEYAGATKETQMLDPYYGPAKGFETVLDLSEKASHALIEKLAAKK